MPPQLLLEMSPPGVLLFTMGVPPPCVPHHLQVSSEAQTRRRPLGAVLFTTGALPPCMRRKVLVSGERLAGRRLLPGAHLVPVQARQETSRRTPPWASQKMPQD